MGWDRFGLYPKDAIKKKGGLFEGSISIKALEIAGPLNWLIGGEKHPNQEDFNKTKRFIDEIINKYDNEEK